MLQRINPQTELTRNLSQALLVAGDAERLLIGSLLIDPDALRLDETRRFLNPEQFAVELWREAYAVILELYEHGKPREADYVAPLVAQACSMDYGDVVRAFMDAMDSVGRIGTAPEYARSVVRQWQHLELRRLALDMVATLQQPQVAIEDAIANVVRESERIRDGFIEPDETAFSLASVVQEYVSQPESEVIPTGIQLLDDGIRGGMRRQQFIVIGARPSVGKSALCGQIAISMAQHGHPVMYLSCEMSTNEMVARWLNQTGLILGDEMDRELFAATPLKAVASSGWTIDRVEAETKLAVAKHGLRVLVIDYLGLIRPSDTRVNRVEQISDMTRRLKVLAAQQDIVVLAAHQFNRAKEGRETTRPKMSDFRDSGSIEQDADILIGIHRDLTPGQQHEACVYVMKQRSGETSDIPMGFNGERTRFVELVPDFD